MRETTVDAAPPSPHAVPVATATEGAPAHVPPRWRRDASVAVLPGLAFAAVGALVGAAVHERFDAVSPHIVAVCVGAIGANVGRGGTQVYSQDVQRCARVDRAARPAYWDVTYRFHGVLHRAQLASPPGPTITVNLNGEPRG